MRCRPEGNCQLSVTGHLPVAGHLPEDAVLCAFAHLVEVKDEIQLADVSEIPIKHLYEEMNALEIGELIVRHVHTE